MRKLTFKIKFPKLRDKWHEIMMRPEHGDGLPIAEMMLIWKREERVKRAARPSSYGNRLEPKYGPANNNVVGNLLAKDRRFKNLRPTRIKGARTGSQLGLWVAVDNPALTLNSNHTPAPIKGEEDGEE